jgi:hypothetical protein
MKLNKEQANVYIKNAKAQGLDDTDALMRVFYSKGHEIEGVDTNQMKIKLGLIAPEPVEQPSRLGQFVQGVARGAVKPVVAPAGALINTIAGNPQEQPINLGEYLGEVQPIGTEFNVENVSGAIGAGFETGANIAGGGSVGTLRNVAQQSGKALGRQALQSAGRLATEGAVIGASSGLGQTMQDTEATLGERIGTVAESTALGAGIGAVAGGVTPALSTVGRKSAGAVNNLATKTATGKTVSTIDDAMKSSKFGITTETAGIKKLGDQSQFLTKAEKRKLLEISPEKGNEYIDTLLKSEENVDAPKVFEKAVQDVEKVVSKYDNVISSTGSEVGKIKQKLSGLSVEPAKVGEIVNDISKKLESKGVQFVDGKFSAIKGKNTPFSKSDIKALNDEIGDTLKNIESSQSMENLILGMERLDNKINYNTTGEVTGGLQSVSKTLRGKLKDLRNSALSPEEVKIFEDYSTAKGFIDEFKKGNSDNKISALLNTVGTKRDFKIKKVAEEIKRVTGEDITDYGYLARILSETAGPQSANRSLLNQYIGEAVSLSPGGIISRTGEAIANKLINVDKLGEIKKAIDFRPTK